MSGSKTPSNPKAIVRGMDLMIGVRMAAHKSSSLTASINVIPVPGVDTDLVVETLLGMMSAENFNETKTEKKQDGSVDVTFVIPKGFT